MLLALYKQVDFPVTMFLSLWIWILLIMDCRGYKCDFEDESCLWLTHETDGFLIEKAIDGRQKGYPSVDVTEGTEEGHYAIAVGGSSKLKYIYSPCFGASGMDCSLRFNSYFSGTSIQETIDVYIQPNCSSIVSKIDSINQQTLGWANHTVNISNYKDPFKIVLATQLPYIKSFIAIDDIYKNECENDSNHLVGCSSGEFRCPSSLCISNDRICNLHHDCEGGEDESLTECDSIPAFGKTTFDSCNFNSGGCWWHNSPGNELNWVIGSGVAPSMMGPQHDHTTQSYDKSGSYVYMKSAGRNAGDKAVLESIVFAPPVNDGSCKVRFYHHMFGKHVFRLQLEVRELCEKQLSKTLIWSRNTRVKKDEWRYEVVPVFNVSKVFVLRFTAYVGYLSAKGDIALDDITLSPECFTTENNTYSKPNTANCGTGFKFNSCGAQCDRGPTQKLCDVKYGKDNSVKVIEESPLSGVQKWKVPETGEYSITAFGGAGGYGARNRHETSYGGYIHAKILLIKGEQIHLLIGQQGCSACNKVSDKDDPNIQELCLLVPGTTSTTSLPVNGSVGGGGGGGGATVIFRIDKITKKPVVLLVAGGGGGLPLLAPTNLKLRNGNLTRSKDYNGPGFGGSVKNVTKFSVFGGKPCSTDPKWKTSGGFGGGGGGCTSGGGGGGYIGGEASIKDNPYYAGQSGTSFAINSSTEVKIVPAIHDRSGLVEIFLPLNCSCQYYCIWQNVTLKTFRCLCPNDYMLAQDGITCVNSSHHAITAGRSVTTNLEVGHWLAIFLPCILVIIIIPVIYLIYKKRLFKSNKNKAISDRMFNTRHNGGTSMATVVQLNANYDIVMSHCPDNQLRELPRRHLKLARLLGHGAFGEVYHGFLASGAHLTEDLKVAVKTLPAICTEQTEIDFLTEAVILSKFNHPNIVKLIGVCFENHPRYIVLELLEGGDLKMFLRESRPISNRCPHLTIKDLLRLCHDVACACQHLEEKHFIHRDIAARNCLLTAKGPSRRAKIADFGMSRDIYRSDYYKKTGKALLPIKWMPPEAFLDGIFTAKTDIWSFGILLWEVFSLGHMPYPGCSNEEVMQTVTMGGRLTAPEGCPSSVYDIITECWIEEASDRPNFSTIVSRVEHCLEEEEFGISERPAVYQPACAGTLGLRLPNLATFPLSTEEQTWDSLAASSNYLEPFLPQSSTDNNLSNNQDSSNTEIETTNP